MNRLKVTYLELYQSVNTGTDPVFLAFHPFLHMVEYYTFRMKQTGPVRFLSGGQQTAAKEPPGIPGRVMKESYGKRFT